MSNFSEGAMDLQPKQGRSRTAWCCPGVLSTSVDELYKVDPMPLSQALHSEAKEKMGL